jgi:hypothetical protein
MVVLVVVVQVLLGLQESPELWMVVPVPVLLELQE